MNINQVFKERLDTFLCKEKYLTNLEFTPIDLSSMPESKYKIKLSLLNKSKIARILSKSVWKDKSCSAHELAGLFSQIISKDSFVLDLLALLKSHDSLTLSHSIGVACFAYTIAKHSGVDTDLFSIVEAGLVHDIGKIFIPLVILNKPGKLTKDEFSVIKCHSILGYNSIKAYAPTTNREVLYAVKQHHEKLDGSGYPAGSSLEYLDTITRIITIADVYDALVSVRPYKEPYTKESAYRFIESNKGSMFDPKLASR